MCNFELSLFVFEHFICVCKFTLRICKFHLHLSELLSCLCELTDLGSGLTLVPRNDFLYLCLSGSSCFPILTGN